MQPCFFFFLANLDVEASFLLTPASNLQFEPPQYVAIRQLAYTFACLGLVRGWFYISFVVAYYLPIRSSCVGEIISSLAYTLVTWLLLVVLSFAVLYQMFYELPFIPSVLGLCLFGLGFLLLPNFKAFIFSLLKTNKEEVENPSKHVMHGNQDDIMTYSV